ncbi:MAG: 8-oxo-dGTP diphosphatase MutT [Xenococcaceae cyanobacterium]
MSQTKSTLPYKRIGVAVIRNDRGQILIDRRRKEGAMGGLWEFPGGKIEKHETVEECIAREIKEELAIEIAVGECLTVVNHTYPTFKISLFVHECQYISGKPQPLASDEIRWVNLEEMSQYNFPEANQSIITILNYPNE